MNGSSTLPQILDALLALMAAEAAALSLIHRCTGRLAPPNLFLPTIAAGAAIMVAMRLALANAAWPLVALALAVAGAFHALDLRARLRR